MPQTQTNISTPEPRTAARGAFLRAVIVLVSGTALAHGISALALPILARLYSPTDFGTLAVFSGCLAILASAACLRYELAIPLPEQDEDALHLLAISLLCTLGIAALVALATLLAPGWIARQLGQAALAGHLWMLSIGVLLAGTCSALQFWFVRKKDFSMLARTRVAQSAAAVSTQISMGLWCPGSLGLLLGYVLNSGIACLSLGRRVPAMLFRPSWALMRRLAGDYNRFPKYSTLEALANTAAIQVPILMIAAMAAPAEAGYLMMAMYLMQTPTALIGTAISQVYLSRAAEEYRQGRLGGFTADILGALLRTGLGPFLAIAILSPLLFALILGESWHRAGVLVSWMTPWFLMQFLASPISMALHVTGQQRQAFLLHLASLAVRVLMVWGANRLASSMLSEWYAFSGFLVYGAYLFVVLRAVGLRPTELAASLRGALKPTLAWALSAGSVNLLVSLCMRP